MFLGINHNFGHFRLANRPNREISKIPKNRQNHDFLQKYELRENYLKSHYISKYGWKIAPKPSKIIF